jgi:hypothetical protein
MSVFKALLFIEDSAFNEILLSLQFSAFNDLFCNRQIYLQKT